MQRVQILVASLLLHILLLSALFWSGFVNYGQIHDQSAGVLHAIAVQVKPQPVRVAKVKKQLKAKAAQLTKRPVIKKAKKQVKPRSAKLKARGKESVLTQKKRIHRPVQAKHMLKQKLAIAPPLSNSLLTDELAAEQKILQQSQQRQQLAQQSHYQQLLIQAIAQHWHVPTQVEEGQHCELLIRLAPGGEVLSVAVAKPSGNHSLDKSARLAVLRASPLPVPNDPVAFQRFRQVQLSVRPQGIMPI